MWSAIGWHNRVGGGPSKNAIFDPCVSCQVTTNGQGVVRIADAGGGQPALSNGQFIMTRLENEESIPIVTSTSDRFN